MQEVQSSATKIEIIGLEADPVDDFGQKSTVADMASNIQKPKCGLEAAAQNNQVDTEDTTKRKDDCLLPNTRISSEQMQPCTDPTADTERIESLEQVLLKLMIFAAGHHDLSWAVRTEAVATMQLQEMAIMLGRVRMQNAAMIDYLEEHTGEVIEGAPDQQKESDGNMTNISVCAHREHSIREALGKIREQHRGFANILEGLRSQQETDLSDLVRSVLKLAPAILSSVPMTWDPDNFRIDVPIDVTELTQWEQDCIDFAQHRRITMEQRLDDFSEDTRDIYKLVSRVQEAKSTFEKMARQLNTTVEARRDLPNIDTNSSIMAAEKLADQAFARLQEVVADARDLGLHCADHGSLILSSKSSHFLAEEAGPKVELTQEDIDEMLHRSRVRAERWLSSEGLDVHPDQAGPPTPTTPNIVALIAQLPDLEMGQSISECGVDALSERFRYAHEASTERYRIDDWAEIQNAERAHIGRWIGQHEQEMPDWDSWSRIHPW